MFIVGSRERRGVLGREFIRETRSWPPRRRNRRRTKSLCTLADLTVCHHAGRGGHPEHYSDRVGCADPISFSSFSDDWRQQVLAPEIERPARRRLASP